MEYTRSIIFDTVNFLSTLENRIVGNTTGTYDFVEHVEFRHSFNLIDNLLNRCSNTTSSDDLNEIKKRVDIARETVELLHLSNNISNTDCLYCDLYLLYNDNQKDVNNDYRYYGKYLNMTNEDFDNLLEEWAEDSQIKSQRHVRKKKKETLDTDDDIKGELAKLADMMKSKAMWYRDVLVKDNQKLSKYTGEQEKQLDSVTHVTKSATKLTRTNQITIRQMIVMVISVSLLTLFMLFIFIIT